ncbi:MAG: winged helix-turn-helix domain-containing protein [Streptosporangiaceae bacterium]
MAEQTERITAAAARRIAVAAQGLADPRPTGRIDARHIRKVVDRIGVLQLDSVNVFCRSHYLPVLARLGPYPRDLLDDLTAHRRGKVRREFVEYWAHMAALIPARMYPLFRWRMEKVDEAWGSIQRIAREQPTLLDDLRNQMASDGPIRSGETGFVRPNRPGSMWNWHLGKEALEYLFFSGQVMASRRVNFERWYDLTGNVLPATVRDAPSLSEADQHHELVRTATRAHGIGTVADIADYFRMGQAPTKVALRKLMESGEVREIEVEGWTAPAYLWSEARRPRRVNARALLSPFDSLVWFRPRTERVFGFHYRIEIYVPTPRRVHGYYVLPFLLGDRLVARVDLKSDRATGQLRVQSAFAEAAVGSRGWPSTEEVAAELAAELQLTAGWLGLAEVQVMPRGDLAAALAAAVARG